VLRPNSDLLLRFAQRRFLQITVTSKGRVVVREDLLWKIADDVDPAWGIDPEAGEWQVTIDGDPGVKMDVSLSATGAHKSAGTLATAARMVNSIPDVCKAEPGFLTVCSGPVPRCITAQVD